MSSWQGVVPAPFRYAVKESASPLTTGTLWTFTGGIEILRVVGLVTTNIQAQTTNIKLSVKPDAQTAVDICANKDGDGLAAGTLLQITGTAANAMTAATGVAVAAPALQANPVVAMCVTSGIVTVTYGAASTGAIRWTMVWRPLTEGATVV